LSEEGGVCYKRGVLYENPEALESLFPRAEIYRRLLSKNKVCESPARYFPYTERHLHALWFDKSLRPKDLKTSRGESVTVEQAGRWNLEAGPDFLGAVLLIGREKRRTAGDVEIHIISRDWKNHGHPNDPRYANVRFHITWFPETVEDTLFPPGTLHLSLRNPCSVDLESIDLSAYPYEEPRASTAFPMHGEDPDSIFQTLENAGEERLRQKTQRMAWMMKKQGEVQVLYEEIAVALGYKHNKIPFRKLAQRLPCAELAQYGTDWKTIYSVLLGLSGLLPKHPGAKWPEASRKELRSLWDSWWREKHKWEETEPLSKQEWNFSGLRPLNHPLRRLCALAQCIASNFFQTLEKDSKIQPHFFQKMGPCFWTKHLGWMGKETQAELIGKGRAQAIELNVFVPYRLAKGRRESLENLPIEPMNSVIKATAYTLFGPDHSPKLYRTALARQGLIQIFNDFILTGKTFPQI